MTLQQAEKLQQQVSQELHGGTVIPLRQRWQAISDAVEWRAPYLRGVQIAELARWWPIAAPLLARLLPHSKGRHSVADLRASVESGKRWLWLSEPDRACAMLTQVVEYPQADVLVIFGIAGRLPKGWRQLLACLEDHARSIGCKQVELYGRRGWTRRLPDYDPGQIVLMKVL